MFFYGRVVIPFSLSFQQEQKLQGIQGKDLRVSVLTGKRVKEDNDFAIKELHLLDNHSLTGFFFILTSNNNDFKVTLRIHCTLKAFDDFNPIQDRGEPPLPPPLNSFSL